MNQRHPRGHHLGIRWEVVSNHFDGDTFRASIILTNHGDAKLPGKGWAIYFNSCRKPVPDSVTGGVTIEHVNGDLFKMLPGPHFGMLASGVSREIGYVANFWSVVETDAPMGFYVVYDEGTDAARAEAIGDPDIEPFVRAEQWTRSPSDNVPRQTAALTYEENRSLSLLPEAAVGKVTPTPLRASYGSGTFFVDPGACVGHPPELAREAEWLRSALSRVIVGTVHLAAADGGVSGRSVSPPADGGASGRSVSPPADGAHAIRLSLDTKLEIPPGGSADQGYSVRVDPNGVEIVARAPAGVLYGIQTLLHLVPACAWKNRAARLGVPFCEIVDAPRFGYRGMHLDVARNFSSKRTVLELLDWMAFYKFNTFHFHLTDDEGWRIPIASLPELTEIGARRGWGRDESESLVPSFGSGPNAENEQGSGHYSREDFVEILQHARDLHIEVIPEVDLPGHARAAIKAMQARCERLRRLDLLDEAEAYRLVDVNDASKYESVQMWKDNVVCIGLESCYTFIDTVVADIKGLFDEAGVPLRTLHVGGDEVPHGAWEQSPLCQAFMREQGMTTVRELEDYFWARFRDILGRHDIGMASWEEVAVTSEQKDGATVSKPNPKLLSARLRSHVWNNVWGWGREDIAYQLANAGYEVVLCNVTNLYLDLAYEKDPEEPGYYWGGFLGTRRVFEFCPFDIYTMATVDLLGNPLDATKVAKMQRLTPEGAKRVIGMQGHMWGENLRNRGRTEYLLFPRIIAVAERAWAQDPGWTSIADQAARAKRLDDDWNEFANRLARREFLRLDARSIGYRIPVPGAKVENGALTANVSAPGMTLRYTLDGSEPSETSPIYGKPVPVPPGAVARVAAFTTTGRRGRSAFPER